MAESKGVGGVVVGLLVLAGALGQGTAAVVKPTAVPAAAKPAATPASAQQALIFLRGTITAQFPSQLNGPGVKDVEVTLLDAPAGGRAVPVGPKVTDAAGRFAFTVLPAEKGKRYTVRPRLTQACCQGCSGFEPAERAFTVQGSETLDFKLMLPSPDLALSAAGTSGGEPYVPVSFGFQIANKGCLPSAPTSLTLSVAQPCCPGECSKHVNVASVPPQGSANVTVEMGHNPGGRGCQFTAAIPAQQFEVKTQDNTTTGTSPNLKLPDFQLSLDYASGLVHARNKGTVAGTVTVVWKCDLGSGGGYAGLAQCRCPALVPVTPSAPTFATAWYPNSVQNDLTIGANGDLAYTLPVITKTEECREGQLMAQVREDHVYEHDHTTAWITFKPNFK